MSVESSEKKIASPEQRKMQLEVAKVLLLGALTLLAVGYFMRSASSILIPITIAWLLSLILSPVIRLGYRFRLPSPVTAGVTVAALLASFTFFGSLIAEPASKWIQDIPHSLENIRSALYGVRQSLDEIKAVSDEVSLIAEVAAGKEQPPVAVEIHDSDWVQTVLTNDLPALSSAVMIVVVLTFFLLCSEGLILRKIIRLVKAWSTKRLVVSAANQIRFELSHYLRTIAVINFFLGLVTALMLYFLDVPNPHLWGLVAGLFNFAPYIGAIATAVMLTLVGFATFDTPLQALGVPGIFLFLSIIEGQFITPAVVGETLSLTPAAIFVAVVFGVWFWGIAGALLAAPLLATLKILFENLRPHKLFDLRSRR